MLSMKTSSYWVLCPVKIYWGHLLIQYPDYPVAVCMTRMPHIITCPKDMNILEAAALLQDHAIDSFTGSRWGKWPKIVGTVTKSVLLDYIILQSKKCWTEEWRGIKKKKRSLYIVFQILLGGTSQKLLSAVTAQYQISFFNNSYPFPFYQSRRGTLGYLIWCLEGSMHLSSASWINSQLASVAREFSQKNGLAYLDLMHPFFEIIQEKDRNQTNRSSRNLAPPWTVIILKDFSNRIRCEIWWR